MKNCFGKNIILPLFAVLFQILANSCKLDVTQEILEPIYPIANHKIYINSNPTGFSVFLDGKNMGIKTPDTIRALTEGTHKLVLKHPYYIDTLININTTLTKNLYIDLLEKEAMMSSLFVNSIPIGAKIFFDDKDINKKTPITLRGLMPGVHKVKLTANRCRDESVEVKLYSKTMTQVTVELDDTTYVIVYSTNNSSIISNSLKKIIVDTDDTKWIASTDKGLFMLKNDVFTQIRSLAILSTSVINDLLIDTKHKRLWVATSSGLAMFDGVKWTQFTEAFLATSITALAEDKFGNILVGTNKGLAKFNNSSWQLFTKELGTIPANDITCITIDNYNNIWVGTSSLGALMHNGIIWQVFDNASGIFQELLSSETKISNFVQSISYDMYNDAMYVYYKAFPKAEGIAVVGKYQLLSWSVYYPAILPIELENIYFFSPQTYWELNVESGAVRITADGLRKYYNKSNTRLLANHFTSVTKDLRGDLWFTTMGGGLMKLKY